MSISLPGTAIGTGAKKISNYFEFDGTNSVDMTHVPGTGTGAIVELQHK